MLWSIFLTQLMSLFQDNIFGCNGAGLDYHRDESGYVFWVFDPNDERTAVEYLNGSVITNYSLAPYENARKLAASLNDWDLIASTWQMKLAADRGLAEAQFEYGLLLSRGGIIRVNEALAARYFHMAASQHHAKALYEFGKCLFKGRGVGQNGTLAIRYFRLAADWGDSDAQLAYGLFLLNGSRLVHGARYLKLSAAQNNSAAEFWYGLCLRDGMGVRENRTAAAVYLNRSAAC
jgi:hypothetical protein